MYIDYCNKSFLIIIWNYPNFYDSIWNAAKFLIVKFLTIKFEMIQVLFIYYQFDILNSICI